VKKNNRPVPYWLSALLTASGYLSYFLSIAGFLGIIVPCMIFLGPFPVKRRFAQFTFRRYLFFLTRQLLPMLQVYSIAEISGFSTTAAPSALYVANHRGRLDALLLLALLSNTAVLIKSKYCRFPLYRAFVKYLDFVAVDSATPNSLGAARGRCKGLLADRKNILVFPEGARATSGNLLPFKEFAFRLACESRVPIVPVIVHSDFPFMANLPGSIFPKNKIRYTLRRLEALYPCDGERPSDFAARVRRRMSEELKTLDRDTVWEWQGKRLVHD
jgi:1-acyl-sn-glycerol-3-phosphate acyltransferase